MVVWLGIMLWSEEMEMNFGTPSASPLQHNKQQTKKTFLILWKTNLTTVLGPVPYTLVIILFPVPTIFPFLWTLVCQNHTWLNLFYLLNKSPIISDILFFFHVISALAAFPFRFWKHSLTLNVFTSREITTYREQVISSIQDNYLSEDKSLNSIIYLGCLNFMVKWY